MPYFTTDLDGVTLIAPDAKARRDVIDTVAEAADADYPEVYLTLDDGRVLGYRLGGTLFQEEDGEVTRIVPNASPETVAQAWTWFVDGCEDALEGLSWQTPEA
ncbi:MAG: hypothetical protein R6V45_10540 [Oceanipulchritudo sp.]